MNEVNRLTYESNQNTQKITNRLVRKRVRSKTGRTKFCRMIDLEKIPDKPIF